MSRRVVCGVCGDPMEPVRASRRYCSIRCRVKASRRALSVTSETGGDPTGVLSVSPPPAPLRGARGAIRDPSERPRLPVPIEVRHVPGGRLVSGQPSGIGGRTTYHVAGRTFGTPREALDFARA